MTESAKLQAKREKLARMSAGNLRQLAKFLTGVAKNAANPIYADRVLGQKFEDAMSDVSKAIWNLSDIVVPRNPKTGNADARSLTQAVVAHAFRPDAAAEDAQPANKKAKTGKVRGEGSSSKG